MRSTSRRSTPSRSAGLPSWRCCARSPARPFTLASGFLSSWAISAESAVSSSARSAWAHRDSCCAAAARCTIRSKDQRTARPAPAAKAYTKVSTVAWVRIHARGSGRLAPPPNAARLKSWSAPERSTAANAHAAATCTSARTPESGQGTNTPEMRPRTAET